MLTLPARDNHPLTTRYGFTMVKGLSYGVAKKHGGKSANTMWLACRSLSENPTKKRSPQEKI